MGKIIWKELNKIFLTREELNVTIKSHSGGNHYESYWFWKSLMEALDLKK